MYGDFFGLAPIRHLAFKLLSFGVSLLGDVFPLAFRAFQPFLALVVTAARRAGI